MVTMQLSGDVAVVGLAYKLPRDIEDDAAFWEVLQGAKNLSSEWPESRMKPDAHPDPRNGKAHSRGGHFITQDPAAFDAPFFGLTAKEAASMDPLQRGTLEVSYRAFENAGFPSDNLKGTRTAVLSASWTEDYIRMNAMDPDNYDRTTATGSMASILPNRVSYYFGLQGPSFHVDTACSSGLSAFDIACKLLASGDADTALVTASNLLLEPGVYQMLRNLQMLSPDSTSKSFDHKANGFARGEGILAFVLKPLSVAVQDGDMIRAVVRAVASNQDGHTPSISQPNPVAQEKLIRSVYAQAGLGLEHTRYVEAHGTGTPVGDPIEMKAIGSVFRDARSAEEPLYVGSVKSNIGHLEGASGLAGILKAILILERGVIPPNALLEKLNPAIDAKSLRVEVPNRCIPWPTTGVRRVSINSFGFGGSNTHVVLEDALHYLQERGLKGHHCTAAVPQSAVKTNGVNVTNGTNGTNGTVPQDSCNGGAAKSRSLLVFSAFDEKAAQRTIEGYTSWYGANKISSHPKKLCSLTHTLAVRRGHMRWRSFAIAGGSEDALSPVRPARVVSEPNLYWAFTGQGAQYVDMGWDLISRYTVFEETLKKVNEVYSSLGCEWSIFDELRDKEHIDSPEYSQPLATAVQIALIELLRHFGVTPKAVVGHSSGEIAAAYAVGALSLVSACKVSYYRGCVAGKLRSTSTSAPGAMVSINLPAEQVPEFLSKIDAKSVGLACVNSPLNVTLSGPEAGIDAVKAKADLENIFAQKLKTGVAYHSSAMGTVAAEYLSLMGELESGDGVPVPVYSTVSGKTMAPGEFTKGQYWVANMVSPVQFAGAVKLMASRSANLGTMDWIEVGPHPVLRRYVQDILGNVKVQYSSLLQRNHSAIQKTLEFAGTLFCRGHPVSITAVNNHGEKEAQWTPLLVNCPPYSFDHSNKLLSENRFSKDYRLRTPTKGGLLGQRSTDWNPLQPRWRSFLSVETHPWIGHHVVSDMVLYPAAAMLIMAFEAVQEMAPADETVVGYFLKEAQFLNPVVVPESLDDRIELVVSLRPVRNQSRDAKVSSWSDVSIFTYAKESHSWTEVFRTSVQASYLSAVDQAEKQKADKAIQEQHQQARKTCKLPIDTQILYGDAFEHGLQYGEWFRLCKDINWDKSGARAVADVSVLDNARYETASIVHPAVLDTMFHALRVSAGQQHAANVPLRVTNAWFTSEKWQGPAKQSVQWLAASKIGGGKSARGEQGSVSALAGDGTVLAVIEKLVTASITRDDSDVLAEGGGTGQKTLLHGIEWKPQLSLLSPEQLSQACKANEYVHDPETMLADHQRRTAVLNIAAVRHVKNTPSEKRTKLDSTLRQHIEWMEHHVSLMAPEERAAAEAVTDAEYEAKLDDFTAAFPTWALYPHVMRSLPAIMSGEIDPLQVIFESEYARAFYASLFQPLCGDGRLASFLDLAAHETPSLRILEVGAGTGGMTVHILNALRDREKRTGASAFSEYMYTDITPAFFESAKARWESEGFGPRMSFRPLNMERAVGSQGFAEHSYDLVIGGSCIHATELLSNTLQNLHRLLKPGGKLMMLEMTKPTDITSCFFATLASGWWLGQEEERVKNKSPLVSDERWDQMLRENGFTGNDLVIMDTKEGEAHIASILVSTALENREDDPASAPRRVFVIDPKQESQKQLGEMLSKGQDAVVSLDEITNTSIGPDDVAVSLVEVDNPLLSSISETQFTQMQSIFKQARSLSWVTAPRDGAADLHFPHYAVAQGFLRTVRAEMPELRIVSLSIEDASNNEMRAKVINQTIEAAFGEPAAPELEYVFRSGQMHTARAVEKISANVQLRSLLYPQLKQLKWAETPAVKLAVGTQGDLQSLRFEQDEKHSQSLGAHDIEIEAKAWGLSQSDVLAALGRLDDDNGEGFGANCSGVVTRIGGACDAQGPQPGDRVAVLARGSMSNLPRAHETRVVRIPKSEALTFEATAAALWPAATAYRALFDAARVCRGDKVLVHEAASAVGQMAVQIAKMEGAEVFVTTDSKSSGVAEEEKEKQFLATTLGIAPEHIFSASHNTTFFAGGVRRVTKGYGVDVVINTLADDQLHASWELLAAGGRFVDISLGKGTSLPKAATSAQNTSFSAVDVLGLPPHVTARLLKDVMALLDQGKITLPTTLHIFPATEVQEAFKKLRVGEGQGRVVLVPPKPDDILPQVVLDPQALRPCKLDENATYLIPGGLGGVGRSIIAWMAACGAKNLIVPSRSGASSAAAASLVSSLSSSGVNITTPKCDATKEAELSALLADIKQNMPPIRGVINCAMVLPNAVFTNMTFEQWSIAVNTKVAVSYNLHRLLPDQDNLDFFIHLASLAGVNGQMASSNYAGGCSFQDALTTCYPGVVTLDVGWMSDVGLIAETAAFQRQLKDWSNMQRLEERELLATLGLICNAKGTEKGQEADAQITGQQILFGLRTPADFLAKTPEAPLPPVLDRPFLSTFARPTDSTKDSSAAAGKGSSAKAAALDHKALFRAAADDEARASVVAYALAEKLGRAIMMSADEVDPDRTLSAYGVDSLMAIDLRNWLGREFGAKLSVFEIMSEERKIKMIAKTVVQKSTMKA